MKQISKIGIGIVVVAVLLLGVKMLTATDYGVYEELEHTDIEFMFLPDVSKEIDTYYVYFYTPDDTSCIEIADEIKDFAKNNTVYGMNIKEQKNKEKLIIFNWEEHHARMDIEIGMVDANKEIQYYEGESAEKYENTTEVNANGETRRYEIVIADSAYRKKNAKAKEGYVYASLITPEIEYEPMVVVSSIEIIGEPTLFKVSAYTIEKYYYGAEDILKHIQS